MSEVSRDSNTPAIYEGFSESQRLWIVGVATFVVLVSLVFSGSVMYQTLQNIQFRSQDEETVGKLTDGIANENHRSVLRAHSITAVVSLKLVANKQATIIVAYAAAMALCTIGFALFLLGADGAFKLNAQTGGGAGGTKLVLSGTAPGLLCFALATVVICFGIVHRSNLNLGSTIFPENAGQTEQRSSENTESGLAESVKNLAGAPKSTK